MTRYSEKYAKDLVTGDVVPNRGVVASVTTFSYKADVEVEFGAGGFKRERAYSIVLMPHETVLVATEEDLPYRP